VNADATMDIYTTMMTTKKEVVGSSEGGAGNEAQQGNYA